MFGLSEDAILSRMFLLRRSLLFCLVRNLSEMSGSSRLMFLPLELGQLKRRIAILIVANSVLLRSRTSRSHLVMN